MSNWHQHIVSVYNGTDEGKEWWLEFNRYDALEGAQNRARKQSSIYTNEVFRVRQDHWDDIYESYFKGGKEVAKRAFVKRNDETERKWWGNEVPALVDLPLLVIETISRLSETFEWEDEKHLYIRSVAFANISFTKKGYNNERMRRVTFPDGSQKFYWWGTEITKEECDNWIKVRTDAIDIAKTFILPKGSEFVGSLKFDNSTFETPSISNIVGQLAMLAKMFDKVSSVTGNKSIAYLANQLHVALENTNDEMADRNTQGSTTTD